MKHTKLFYEYKGKKLSIKQIRERNKKIMARPVNPMKDGYLAKGLGIFDEVMKSWGCA